MTAVGRNGNQALWRLDSKHLCMARPACHLSQKLANAGGQNLALIILCACAVLWHIFNGNKLMFSSGVRHPYHQQACQHGCVWRRPS